MTRTQLIARVRAITRDRTASVFLEADIISFLDEAIDRCKQIIVELADEVYLTTATTAPALIPEKFQHLLAIYASSRCFFQDDRHFQATNLMNEFEVKLNYFKSLIDSGEVFIYELVDGVSTVVTNDNEMDFVETKSYWGDNHTGIFADADLDDGVEGVE